MADRRALLQPVRARTPGELGAGRQQLLGKEPRRRDNDPRRAVAPLEPRFAVRPFEAIALARRPVRQHPLVHRVAFEDLDRVGEDAVPPIRRQQLAAAEQRLDDSDEAVRRAEAAAGVPEEPLRPEAVLVARFPDRVGGRLPDLRPALVPGPVQQRPRGKQPARCAPHHLVGVALAALENPSLDRLHERRVPGDAPRDHEVAGLAAEEPGVRCSRQLEVLRFRELRCLTRTLERPLRCRREVDPAVGVPPAPECVQRPYDSRSSAVETGERRRRPPRVPLLRGPERHGVEPLLGIGDDRADAAPSTLLVPRLLCQGLECLRPKEHLRTS